MGGLSALVIPLVDSTLLSQGVLLLCVLNAPHLQITAGSSSPDSAAIATLYGKLLTDSLSHTAPLTQQPAAAGTTFKLLSLGLAYIRYLGVSLLNNPLYKNDHTKNWSLQARNFVTMPQAQISSHRAHCPHSPGPKLCKAGLLCLKSSIQR